MKRIIGDSTPLPLDQEKAAFRTRMKAAREGIPTLQRAILSERVRAALQGLPEYRRAQRLFIFISSGDEVHTHPLIRDALAEGREVAVPKILSRTEMIASRLRDWGDLAPAQLGILSPTTADRMAGPLDVVITPGLAFTPQGHRIGFGAGYYDRWFAGHSVRTKIGVAFDLQVVDRIPCGSLDVSLDIIVTDARVLRVSRNT